MFSQTSDVELATGTIGNMPTSCLVTVLADCQLLLQENLFSLSSGKSSTFAAHRMGAWKGRAKSEGASETFSFQINP